MTVEEAIQKYAEKFGSFPSYCLMGASDEYIVEIIKKALETGEEIDLNEKGKIY